MPDETKVVEKEKVEIINNNWVEDAENWLDAFLDTVQVENNGRNQSK